MELLSLRKKVGCVRQENACLSLAEELLTGDLDAVQNESATSRSQVHPRCPRVGLKNNPSVMYERIYKLEAELEAQAKQLKEEELRSHCSQEAAAHSEIVVSSLTEELNILREELDNKIAQGKRAEQQRNQALENAETLKEAFKDYKAKISLKLERVMESESKLKLTLIECDREKEELEMKNSVLEREKAEHNQAISQLKEELRQAKCLIVKNSDLQAHLEEATRKAAHLERQLVEWEHKCSELASLRSELAELRNLTQSQEQRVAQSLEEAQQTRVELTSLETILSLLHLREDPVASFCVRPCMLPPVDYTGTAHLLKLKPGEGYQQLVRVLQSLESERNKQKSLVEQLQTRLSRAQEEICSLQSSMAQRASHYQSLHTELLDKVSQASSTEKELKRKCARVAALEKQLQEKTSAYSQVALKNTDLENQLLEKTSALQHHQTLMTKKQREYQQTLKSQSQQCTEQQHRIEMLQLSVEEAQSRAQEMEKRLSLIQQERDEIQESALLLQTSVEQLTQEKQALVAHNEALLHSLQDQAAQSTTKVCELQSCLSACREELDTYLQQMEEVKKDYENELQKTHAKMGSLKEKLHSTSLVCQRSSEQNLQLQLSLQQQQTMLTESTAHISELEERESQLQNQVSSLEHELERVRASLQDEVRSKEQETLSKDKHLQEMNQRNTELSSSVNYLTSEVTKCQGELMSKESELQRLKKDISVKTSQIRCMDENLQHMKSQIDKKSDIDLEEKLRCCEADRLQCTGRVQTLEEQLQGVRGELVASVEQLHKLRDVLQRTQSLADERQASVEKLTVKLSETHRELEERTHEVLDMDNALKERQGELQQRAQLLGQLDVAIKEHKQEMERKVESLQKSLEARERELRETQRELSDRNKKECQDLAHQLQMCQQKLQIVLTDLKETQHHCDTLTHELDTITLQAKDKEVQLCSVKEELALKEEHWLQLEARLKSMVSSLEQELEMEREQHSRELDSLQENRGQLLKVSEQLSSTMRSSQEQLTAKLQQCQNQLEQTINKYEQSKSQLEQTNVELDVTRKQASHLQTQLGLSQSDLLQCKAQLEQSRNLYEQARAQNSQLLVQLEQLSIQLNQSRVQVAQLKTQLTASEKSVETSTESLLIKESEVTRLQARISSMERAAERQNPDSQTESLPPGEKLTHSSECSSSAHSPTSSPRNVKTPLSSNAHTHSTCLNSPGHTHTPHWPESHQAQKWLQNSSIESSLDLPLSLKATLREALSKQPWDSSSCSISPFPDSVDQSWQGLSGVDATASSDLSFNPLTYMVDKPDHGKTNSSMQAADEWNSESRRASGHTLVGGEEQMDASSLTGMLRFVNQTLAMQEDPSLWSSTGFSKT